MSWDNVLHKKITIYLFYFLIFIYPLLFICQGFDFTDSGWSLTIYQSFLDSPNDIDEFSFIFILPNFVGSIAYKLIGDLGYLGQKLAWVVLIYLHCFIVYKILRFFFEKEYSCFLVLLSLLSFTVFNFISWINYDNISSLFYLASAYYLVRFLHGSNVFN